MARHLSYLVSFLMLLLALEGCTSPPNEAQSSLLNQAAQEATRIVQEAQATALVIKAKAEAEQINLQANAIAATSTSSAINSIVEKDEEQPVTAVSTTAVEETQPAEAQQVEIVRVGFAAEGGFITIYFRAPPEVAEGWWQGDILVIEEESGTEYDEVPVMPRIGPLISKPQFNGQVGYAMLVNTPPGLQPGAQITVVLGKYRFEDIIIE